MSAKALTTDFPLVEKGYDPNQVDEYLATQMLQLREELDAATARVAQLETELSAAREREDAIQLTMVIATRARDELIDRAKEDAEQLVGEARREAFVLMTESRKDADLAIAEGKAMLADARTEALAVVTEAEEETNQLIAERQQAIAKLHAEYEAESATLIDRINTLRSISNDIADKSNPTPENTKTPNQPSPYEDRTADAPRAANEPVPEHDSEAPTAENVRGSFYSRRSAKLPRLGEEAGRQALAAANALRVHIKDERADSPEEHDDLAARTA